MNTPSAVSVLIADDEASIRNGLRSAVESLDLNLQVLGTARNGLEAWEFIQTYSPDLVITDIRMPICDGLEQLPERSPFLVPDIQNSLNFQGTNKIKY